MWHLSKPNAPSRHRCARDLSARDDRSRAESVTSDRDCYLAILPGRKRRAQQGTG